MAMISGKKILNYRVRTWLIEFELNHNDTIRDVSENQLKEKIVESCHYCDYCDEDVFLSNSK